jgi:hypothetical protein
MKTREGTCCFSVFNNNLKNFLITITGQRKGQKESGSENSQKSLCKYKTEKMSEDE